MNRTRARSKLIVLDSCNSGIAGASPVQKELATINNGVTVLTASTDDQYATEQNDRGVFPTLFVDALMGGAVNLTGHVTPGSIHVHIHLSMGAFQQRPVFKTNVNEFISLREVTAPIDLVGLRQIVHF